MADIFPLNTDTLKRGYMKKFLTLLFLLGGIFNMVAAEGTLCLTFDDRYFENWKKAIPLFKKYNATVTFFVYGNIDTQAVETMKILQSAGHTIGLHGINHVRSVDYIQKNGTDEFIKNEIMPQLEICRKNGITIRAFAYPFSQRSSETDQALFPTFDFLRTSWAEIRKKESPLVNTNQCFLKKIAGKQLFYGFPGSGNFNMDEIKAAMKRAAEEKSVLVLYAHDITETIPPSHHIATSQLTELLEYAKTLKLSVKGFNEL